MGILLPSKKFTVESSKSSLQVSKRLKNETTNNKSECEPYKYYSYTGYVNDAYFKVRPRQKYNPYKGDPCAPTIEGTFTDTEKGCNINIKMRPHGAMMVLYIYSLLATAYIIIFGIYTAICENSFKILVFGSLFMIILTAVQRVIYFFLQGTRKSDYEIFCHKKRHI